MIIDFNDHLFGVSHQGSDFLNADLRDLVAEVGAVIMPEYMSGQIKDYTQLISAAGGKVNLVYDPRPHLDIAGFGHESAILLGEEIRTRNGTQIALQLLNQIARERHGALPEVFGILDVRIVAVKAYGLSDGQCLGLQVNAGCSLCQGFPTAQAGAEDEKDKGLFFLRLQRHLLSLP